MRCNERLPEYAGAQVTVLLSLMRTPLQRKILIELALIGGDLYSFVSHLNDGHRTKGSANLELADPEVVATCDEDTVTVKSNGIPDFPYIATSTGVPEANIVDYVFPATPTPAENSTDIPIAGEIGVAINGIPIYGPTEGPGGDVNARPVVLLNLGP